MISCTGSFRTAIVELVQLARLRKLIASTKALT